MGHVPMIVAEPVQVSGAGKGSGRVRPDRRCPGDS